MPIDSKRYHCWIVLLIFLLLGSLLLHMRIGVASLQWKDFVSFFACKLELRSFWCNDYTTLAVLDLRMPRVLFAGLAGFGLALCGSAMQGLFRTALAEPYLLGVASGATLGASVAALWLGWMFLGVSVGSFLGGFLVACIVYLIAHFRMPGSGKQGGLILVGVTLSSLFAAATSLLVFGHATTQKAQLLLFWLLGSLSRATWIGVGAVAVVLLLGTPILFSQACALNALALGDDMAQHLGFRPLWVQRIVLMVVVLISTTLVAFAGPIAFVGLVVPHAVRLLTGPDHRFLLLLSALCGALFLLWCDFAARLLLAPQADIPIGIVTSFLGSLIFLFLLISKRSLAYRSDA